MNGKYTIKNNQGWININEQWTGKLLFFDSFFYSFDHSTIIYSVPTTTVGEA